MTDPEEEETYYLLDRQIAEDFDATDWDIPEPLDEEDVVIGDEEED